MAVTMDISDVRVTVEWTSGGVPLVDETVTRRVVNIKDAAKGNVNIRMDVKNVASPPTGRIRGHVRYSTDPTFATFSEVFGPWVTGSTINDLVLNIANLQAKTLYYVRAYAESESVASANVRYDGSFWMNRDPNVPTSTSPLQNAQFLEGDDITFTLNRTDPDDDPGNGAPPVDGYLSSIQYRVAGTPTTPAGPWLRIPSATADTATISIVADSSLFTGGTFYEWQAMTTDRGNGSPPFPDPSPPGRSDWSGIMSFYVGGTTTPPVLTSPINDVAVIVNSATRDTRLEWKFLSPDPGAVQDDVNIEIRKVGEATWFDAVTLEGGADQFFDLNYLYYQLEVGSHYEWRVQTQAILSNSDVVLSGWSQPARFWVAPEPGSGSIIPAPGVNEPAPPLGCGNNRFFVYDRGGKVLRGEITGLARLQWGRVRDDISGALCTAMEWDDPCAGILSQIRSWIHEIVVFRDGERVWEGPITRVEYGRDYVSVEAKDVMAYPYRRILRQGYNDSYQLVNGIQRGLHTVVERALSITLNCLAYDDPNILQWVTPIQTGGDARQSRITEAYSVTAWGEIDDLAATAGLDYTTVGRRILYWDTHTPVGILPEMRDGDFSDSPIVTEYGMNLANYFAVTNNNGVWGSASRLNADGVPDYYGWIEQLASAYGESEGAPTEEVLTPAARAQLVATLSSQAERNISSRWPTPIIVRVPDNSTLNPKLNLGINQLVPGVQIPLRAVGTLRRVTQIQKLDSMTVTQDASGEKISVVMSPAPLSGDDTDIPDSEV